MSESFEIKKLSASYGDKEVLRDINFSLQQGKFVCLCGPNGAGKSTLLSVMAGVKDSALKVKGEIKWVNSDNQSVAEVSKLSRRECARIIAYMQQNEYSEWDFKVRDYVLQGRYVYTRSGHYSAADYKIADGVLADLGLSLFTDRYIHSLSGGEFQKVRLARALAQTPKFLLLDEPAANLDYVYEPHLMQLLRDTAHSKNLGVLATVHDINLAARFADRIILLPPKKSVLSGAPSDIMNTENLKYTFGVDFECKEIKSFQSLQ
ncbi:ABC transporter ATP-binding protein [Treponema bryantii]|uniref:ABC transporter ATP-binding protein n=1 Tax=Treponema bryantii TaxID=163 RepID=UPI002B27C8B0|nr:iron ABC transporter ATP-binding protein [Treponema bryantii]